MDELRCEAKELSQGIETAINEPMLTPEEERQLGYRVEDGDIEARERLLKANLRLVVDIAQGYAGRGLGPQDIVVEGILGLMFAVESFDPSMKTPFSTFASPLIRESIERALVGPAPA